MHARVRSGVCKICALDIARVRKKVEFLEESLNEEGDVVSQVKKESETETSHLICMQCFYDMSISHSTKYFTKQHSDNCKMTRRFSQTRDKIFTNAIALLNNTDSMGAEFFVADYLRMKFRTTKDQIEITGNRSAPKIVLEKGSNRSEEITIVRLQNDKYERFTNVNEFDIESLRAAAGLMGSNIKSEKLLQFLRHRKIAVITPRLMEMYRKSVRKLEEFFSTTLIQVYKGPRNNVQEDTVYAYYCTNLSALIIRMIETFLEDHPQVEKYRIKIGIDG